MRPFFYVFRKTRFSSRKSYTIGTNRRQPYAQRGPGRLLAQMDGLANNMIFAFEKCRALSAQGKAHLTPDALVLSAPYYLLRLFKAYCQAQEQGSGAPSLLSSAQQFYRRAFLPLCEEASPQAVVQSDPARAGALRRFRRQCGAYTGILTPSGLPSRPTGKPAERFAPAAWACACTIGFRRRILLPLPSAAPKSNVPAACQQGCRFCCRHVRPDGAKRFYGPGAGFWRRKTPRGGPLGRPGAF